MLGTQRWKREGLPGLALFSPVTCAQQRSDRAAVAAGEGGSLRNDYWADTAACLPQRRHHMSAQRRLSESVGCTLGRPAGSAAALENSRRARADSTGHPHLSGAVDRSLFCKSTEISCFWRTCRTCKGSRRPSAADSSERSRRGGRRAC